METISIEGPNFLLAPKSHFKTKYRKTIKERAQTNPLYSKFRKNKL